MKVYYNEFDPFAAAWLRELIQARLIIQGDVDERSITEVQPKELEGYIQCHFFAGIGVWSYALQQAGWGNKPVWTGSCPCQPFSAAGKRKGMNDDRHLWPEWFRLIEKCKPITIFGEQVASKDGLAWFDTVSTDLEGAHYTVGACDTSAAGFGAPHIRQRLYFCGMGNARQGRQLQIRKSGGPNRQPSSPSPLADAAIPRLERSTRSGIQKRSSGLAFNGGLGEERLFQPKGSGFWKDCEWLPFRDGKRRPVEPGTFPLVNGAPNRVGRLRGYGNALCAPQAQAFVEAYLEIVYAK